MENTGYNRETEFKQQDPTESESSTDHKQVVLGYWITLD
jgi:hypothetical protein